MQQEQIREQYQLLNLTRIEIDENGKLLRKLDQDLLQFYASFTLLS